MASFVIEGGHRLSGEIHPQGAKNEVLQIICATLLTAEEVTVNNIPDILDVNNLIQRRRRETLSWPSKIAEGSPLSGDAALASARICLTHEEGLSLSDDAALALVRICLTPRSRRGNLEQGTKTMLKPEESPHWAKEPILAKRAAGRVATLGRRSQFWREGRQQLGWRRCQCGA